MKRKLFLRLIITFLIAFVIYYVTLPAINLHNPGFYVYLLFILFIFKFISLFFKAEDKIKFFKQGGKINIRSKENLSHGDLYLIYIVVAVFVLIVISNLIYSPLFMSKRYSNRLVVSEDNSFQDDIVEVDFNQIPLLDKDSSSKLGDRVMGQMSELVSQFEVSSLYTQINYNNEIIRVTPLEYASGIKWLTNRKNGVKGYITVNSVDGESKLIKIDKGMKYMPSAYFNENLNRKLRFTYPTKIFGKASFEIDNEGNPYWIVPTIKYSAVEKLEDVDGIVMLDPISGDSKYYSVKDIPTWVDQVYSANLIIDQFDDRGMYKNGFLNSIFSQKGVVQTTDGYNYMIQNDDVYLYTGVTSISSDESNIGFIIANLRTKETKYYNVPGAEEYSAMYSAMGQVQQMDYDSTFPLLINLNNRPTYLISLKDDAGLVKMYAFVDVEDYQKVSVSDSSLGVSEAARIYLNNVDFKNKNSLSVEKNIKIKSITNATIDGISYYYIIDDNNQKYKVSIKISDNLPFYQIGDVVNIKFNKEKDIIDIIEIK